MFLLLAFIYLVFISLGLPDSLFGAAWPTMHLTFGVEESFAGIYMIITAVGSGGMSFFAGPLIRKFGTGKVTVVSIFLTAIGMLTVGLAPHIAVAMVGSIVMGLGAGAIDTGLNSYVSLHYKARHMSWLHAFWGIGVTVSPLIMSVFLDKNNNWQGGYRCVAYIQFAIFVIALCSLPLWKKYDKKEDSADVPAQKTPKKSFFSLFGIPGVLWSILALGFYVAMEYLIGTWGASYAVNVQAVRPAVAARWVSVYYGGIMLGRIVSGFASVKLNDKQLIRLGVAVMSVGMIVFALPIGEKSMVGFLFIGIGFGPVFPSTIHAVPERFGTEYVADITGIQMGGSYAIGWAVQLSFGYLSPYIGFSVLPYILIVFALLLFIANEITERKVRSESGPAHPPIRM